MCACVCACVREFGDYACARDARKHVFCARVRRIIHLLEAFFAARFRGVAGVRRACGGRVRRVRRVCGATCGARVCACVCVCVRVCVCVVDENL